jgi:ribonucleoside-diphosphate reductase alpha chain
MTEDIIESLKTYALTFDHEKVLEIEEIQDMVENKLMEYGYFHVAKKYIIYRQEKKYERSLKQNEIQEKLQKNIFQITKSN